VIFYDPKHNIILLLIKSATVSQIYDTEQVYYFTEFDWNDGDKPREILFYTRAYNIYAMEDLVFIGWL